MRAGIMHKKENTVSVALLQMRCDADRAKNMDRAMQMTKEAVKKGAQIVCLPELFCSKYFCQENNKKFFRLAEPVPGPTTEVLGEKAKKLGVVVVASIFEKTKEEHYFNTAVVINADGNFLGKYRKVHIPDDPKNHYSEMFYFRPGNLGYLSFETKFARIGPLVCWDQWYPEAARVVALKGAQILFYPTAIGWPQQERAENIGRIEYDAWVTIQRSHAIANSVFVAAVNRTGKEDSLDFWGGSFVCDPFGKILAEASHDKEEVLVCPVNLDRIGEVRKDWPFLSCRRTDTFGSLIKKIGQS